MASHRELSRQGRARHSAGAILPRWPMAALRPRRNYGSGLMKGDRLSAEERANIRDARLLSAGSNSGLISVDYRHVPHPGAPLPEDCCADKGVRWAARRDAKLASEADDAAEGPEDDVSSLCISSAIRLINQYLSADLGASGWTAAHNRVSERGARRAVVFAMSPGRRILGTALCEPLPAS